MIRGKGRRASARLTMIKDYRITANNAWGDSEKSYYYNAKVQFNSIECQSQRLDFRPEMR